MLVEHLKDIVNAASNYSLQSTWGYKNNKSEWSGMIGELVRNEADIGGIKCFYYKKYVFNVSTFQVPLYFSP